MSTALESEIGAALTSETVTAVELSALIIKAQEAIVAADAKAKRCQEAVYELDSDPKAAHAAMEEAVITSGRFNTALTRLHRKKAAAENAERVAAWNKDFKSMTARRDALSAELVAAFSELSRVAEIFSRATLFEAELSRFHQSRPSGVPGLLLGAELEARGLQSFTRDHPSILQQVKLFALSGAQIWPPQQKRDWVHSIPVIQGTYGGVGPDWWRQEIQEARAAQVKAESDRVTAFYKREAEARAAREHQEDLDRWKNVGGAGK